MAFLDFVLCIILDSKFGGVLKWVGMYGLQGRQTAYLQLRMIIYPVVSY